MALSALAHPARLTALAALRAAPEGLAAGELARLAGLRQNSMSPHLAALERSGLIYGHRQGRFIIYHFDAAIFRRLAMGLNKLGDG